MQETCVTGLTRYSTSIRASKVELLLSCTLYQYAVYGDAAVTVRQEYDTEVQYSSTTQCGERIDYWITT